MAPLRTQAGSADEFQQGIGYGVGPMPRQIVPRAFHDAARDEPREPLPIGGRIRRRPTTESARRAPQHDGRNFDGWAGGEPALDLEESGLSGCVHLPVPVGMDHNGDEVRVVERRRGAPVDFVGVFPFRRPRVPKIADDVVAILFERRGALIGIEVPHVPEPGCLSCRHRPAQA